MDVLDGCACSGGNLPRFVQPVLLALLAQEPAHGYALMHRLENTGLFTPQSPDMTGCYRMLRDMEHSGVLASVPCRGEGPSRKKYMVTALGRRCLKRWIASLSENRDHLERVLGFLLSVPEPGVTEEGEAADDSALCPEPDRLFMEELRARTLRGELPERNDILRLLAYAPVSSQTAYLGRLARDMVRAVADDTCGVWAAIGVDSVSCPMNCRFCAFGASWGVVREDRERSLEDIVAAARRYAAEGASWIVLRTTEHYGTERLCGLAHAVRKVLPRSCALVANTGQSDAGDIRRLGEAGVEVMYHALRLGEGRDTPFDPSGRRRSLELIRAEGLTLAHLVEPLGQEHEDSEIADVLLTALSSGARICGVMARSNVPGTPFEGADAVSDARIAQIAAIIRLCGGVRTPYVCVHPPVSQAVAWGANVLVVETGAIPRDGSDVSGEWHDFSVQEAKELLSGFGYVVPGMER